MPAGTTVALVGATGSGKTTLVGLLGRLYDVDHGQVYDARFRIPCVPQQVVNHQAIQHAVIRASFQLVKQDGA